MTIDAVYSKHAGKMTKFNYMERMRAYKAAQIPRSETEDI
jgi:hypothetical protein